MPERGGLGGSLTRADRWALLISLIGVLAAYLVADRVYERMPHLEDEMAFVWQAEVITRGKLTLPSPPVPNSFLVPFVVDYHGQRFGKYPLGWPAALSVGVFLHLRDWVNPLLAGLAVWLTYRLGKRILGETVGLLAAGLMVISPFFLMISGTLLSHPLGLALSAAFALAWLDTFSDPAPPRRWLPLLVAALCLGVLILTRPLSAVGVAVPFAVHGVYLLIRGDWKTRKYLLLFGLIVLALASLHFLWQFAVTGDPRLNPYKLWWSYDDVGFGPGHGRSPQGHTLMQGWINTKYSLRTTIGDMIGWNELTWGLLALGILASLRARRAFLVLAVYPSLVAVYMAYWVGFQLLGPRYYYEGLYSVMLAAAAGIAFLAGWPLKPDTPLSVPVGWRRARAVIMAALLIGLVAYDLGVYLPKRLPPLVGLYDVNRALLAPFESPSAQKLTPALVIVKPKIWSQYAALLELSNPFHDTPFIFVISRGPAVDPLVASHFPDRKTWYYYIDQPWHFYEEPR